MLSDARAEVARAAKPLADAIEAELRSHGQQIESLHATMQALREATESYRHEGMKVEAALLAVEPVVGYKRSVPVSREIVEVMAKLHGKGPALPVRIIEQASWPNALVHQAYNRGAQIAA